MGYDTCGLALYATISHFLKPELVCLTCSVPSRAILAAKLDSGGKGVV